MVGIETGIPRVRQRNRGRERATDCGRWVELSVEVVLPRRIDRVVVALLKTT